MVALGQRPDPMKGEPRRAAPHRDIAALEPESARPVVAAQAAEQENRGQAERHRHDRAIEGPLVLVLMQRQPRTGLIAVDQAGIGYEAVEARRRRSAGGEVRKQSRNWRPRPLRFRIGRAVAIAATIWYPAHAAIAHRERHMKDA